MLNLNKPILSICLSCRDKLEDTKQIRAGKRFSENVLDQIKINRITSLKAPSGNIIGAEEGIFFGDNSDNGVVIGNTINGASFGNGILITDRGVAATGNGSDNVFILDNTIQDASTTSSGIRVENSNDSHIGDAAGAPTVTRLVNGYATININDIL